MEKIFTGQVPRLPTDAELRQLQDLIESEGSEPCVALDAYIAVYDGYMTGGPGYVGNLMSVVWDGSPTFFYDFTWNEGKIERCLRDY